MNQSMQKWHLRQFLTDKMSEAFISDTQKLLLIAYFTWQSSDYSGGPKFKARNLLLYVTLITHISVEPKISTS